MVWLVVVEKGGGIEMGRGIEMGGGGRETGERSEGNVLGEKKPPFSKLYVPK